MEHSQLVSGVVQEQKEDLHYLHVVFAHSEQESEFVAVGEDMEKQEKQNYKYEVHLLVPNNHFVVPVIEIL